jgi:hypothetical protein
VADIGERGRHHDRKHELDQEAAFRLRNRRNRLLGTWIATSYLGLEGDAVTEYAKAVVMADFEKPGDDDVLDKIRADVTAAGRSVSDAELSTKLGEFTARAKAELQSEA